MNRYLFVVIGLIIYLGAPAAALGELPPQETKKSEAKKYLLAYKFKSGETLRWNVLHQATIKTTIQGTTQTARTRSESIKAWKVTDVKPTGHIQFVHSVESVKMTNQLSNRAKLEYDSQRDAKPPPGFETAARTIGVPLTIITMTPSGEILKRENKQAQPARNDTMPITMPLPNQPVAIGHVWNEPHHVQVALKGGGRRQIKTRRRFQLKGVRSGVATISVDYQVMSPVRDPAIEAQLAQRLTNGTVKFDVDAGRLISQQTDVEKRVLGFSGATSSMDVVIRFTEQLLKSGEKVARKP